MRRKYIFFLVIILMITGCVKNNPVEPERIKIDPNIIEGFSGSSILLTQDIDYDVNNRINAEYDIWIKNTTGKLRVFLLVEGYLNEFSMNNSQDSIFHDTEPGEEKRITISFTPSLHGYKKGDEVQFVLFYIMIDESIEFEDHLYHYYASHTLAVSSKFSLGIHNDNSTKFREHDFEEKFTRELMGEGATMYDDWVSTNKTSSQLGLGLKGQFPLKTGMNGLKIEENEDYYITKIGAESLIVYPLKNGELLYENEQLLAYHFIEDALNFQYSFFDFKKHNIDIGDKISFLVWRENTEHQFGEYGRIILE